MRDHAATEFVHHTGSTWRPRTGSVVNRQHMTAALIDSRDFLAAKRRAETEVMLPAGPKVVLVFPGTGIEENLADKAKKLRIPVVKFEKGA